jgi:pimeloyl-ACP methyl ester carboxylesterase
MGWPGVRFGAVVALCGFLLQCWATPHAASASEPVRAGYHVNVGTDHAPLRLWVEEQGRGEAMLLIHGFGASSYMWRKLVPQLARTHRVIAVDLKGAGASDKPLDDAYSVTDQAVLLRRLIDRQGLRSVTLVGHSYGGGIALALALDLNQNRPGVLKRLVLISSMAYPQQLPDFLTALQTPVVGAIGVFAIPPEVQAYAGLFSAYRDPAQIAYADVRAYARPLYDPATRLALLATASALVPSRFARLISRYRTIGQPALVVSCAADPIIPLWIARRLARDLPKGRLAIIKNCGHVPQEETPAQLLEIIARWQRT